MASEIAGHAHDVTSVLQNTEGSTTRKSSELSPFDTNKVLVDFIAEHLMVRGIIDQ